MNHNYHHQREDHDGQRHQHQHHHRPAARRELAPHDPLLASEEPAVSQEQDQDAHGQERRAQRPADVAQRLVPDGHVRVCERSVQPEELGDGDADGCKGQ